MALAAFLSTMHAPARSAAGVALLRARPVQRLRAGRKPAAPS